jgi:hypothetical protein
MCWTAALAAVLVDKARSPFECRASALASRSCRSEPPLTKFSLPAASRQHHRRVSTNPTLTHAAVEQKQQQQQQWMVGTQLRAYQGTAGAAAGSNLSVVFAPRSAGIQRSTRGLSWGALILNCVVDNSKCYPPSELQCLRVALWPLLPCCKMSVTDSTVVAVVVDPVRRKAGATSTTAAVRVVLGRFLMWDVIL